MSDVPAILGDLGMTHIRVRGDEVWASCPAHHDSGDSWSVNSTTGQSSCFACGYREPLEMIVMEIRACSRWDATRYIRSFGVTLATPEEIEASRDEIPRRQATREFVPEIAIIRYGPVPDAQLAGRKLTRIAAEAWGLRWNEEDETWVLPVRNPGNELLGWQEKGEGRRFRNRPPRIRMHGTVFGAENLVRSERIAIVESPLDAVYLDTLGITAVSSFGASVSDTQMIVVADHAHEICLALDNDAAGEANMIRLAHTWMGRVPLSVITYWPGAPKDPGAMTPEEVARAFTTTHALDWLGAHDVSRSTKTLPKRSRGSHGGTKASAPRFPNGARQDGVLHRRRGAPDSRR